MFSLLVVMVDRPCSEVKWKSTGYPLHSPVSPFTSPPVRHRMPSDFNWTLMLDTTCSEVVRRVVVTHSISQFPLHFPFQASSCAITFQLDSTPHHSVLALSPHPLLPSVSRYDAIVYRMFQNVLAFRVSEI